MNLSRLAVPANSHVAPFHFRPCPNGPTFRNIGNRAIPVKALFTQKIYTTPQAIAGATTNRTTKRSYMPASMYISNLTSKWRFGFLSI